MDTGRDVTLEERMCSQEFVFQDQYLTDLEFIIKRESYGMPRKRIIMLSGGMDSFVLVAICRKLWPKEELFTLTIEGDDPVDSRGAKEVAEYFNTTHYTYTMSLSDLIARIPSFQGTGYSRLSQVIFHIMFSSCLETFGVGGCHVLEGHGADKLYGSTKRHIYKKAPVLANTHGCTMDEARTLLKADSARSDKSGCGRIFSCLVQNLGGKPIMPYLDSSLDYMLTVPYSLTSPENKSFIKDGLRYKYHLGDIVERTRMSMQNGTGLRERFREYLLAEYKDRGETVEAIVTNLSRAT